MEKRRLLLRVTTLCVLLIGASLSLLHIAHAADSAAVQMERAILKEDTRAVQTLLAQGANPNAYPCSVPTSDDFSPLMRAASLGNLPIVRALVAHGADIHLKHPRTGINALIYAAWNEKMSVVQYLLEKGARVNDFTLFQDTALLMAVKNVRVSLKLIELLLKYKANPDLQNRDGETALMCAIQRDRGDIVKILLDSGASVNRQNKDGETALFMAINPHWSEAFHHVITGHSSKPDLNTIRNLLARKPDLEIKNDEGYTVLRLALEDNEQETADLLLAAGAKMRGAENGGLIGAACRGDVAAAQKYLKAGADPNTTNRYDSPVLIEAAEGGNAAVVALLLDRGAKIETHGGYQGRTALMAGTKSVEVTRLLLDRGANKKVEDAQGRTVLAYAAETQAEGKVIHLLLDRGMDANEKNKEKVTVLMRAAGHGSLSVAEALLDRGAQIASRDSSASTALHHATLDHPNVRIDKTPMLQLLLKRGAEVDAKGWRGRTPLWMFIEFQANFFSASYLEDGYKKMLASMVETLIEAGADVNIKDSDGQSLLQMAIDKSYPAMVERLRKAGAKE